MKNIFFSINQFKKVNRTTWPKNNKKIIYIGKDYNQLFKTLYFYDKHKMYREIVYFYTDRDGNKFSYDEKDEQEVLGSGYYSLNVGLDDTAIRLNDGDYWIYYEEVFK